MKKNWKALWSFLLIMALVLQFPGMTAFAEGTDADAALVYEIYVQNPDAESAEKFIPVSAESEEELLNAKSCSVKLRKASEEDLLLTRVPGKAKLGDLLERDLTVAPPEGFYVAKLYLRGNELAADACKALDSAASASSAALTVKAGSLGVLDAETEELVIDKARLSSLSTADPQVYTLGIVLVPIDPEADIVVKVKDPESSETMKAGTDYTAPAAPDAPEGRKFAGWTLLYDNGASLLLQPGETVKPYTNCELEATWLRVITVTAKAPVAGEDGSFSANGYSVSGALAEGDTVESVKLTIKEEDGKAVSIPSDATMKNADGVDVGSRYDIHYVQSEAVEAPQNEEKVTLTITAKSPVAGEDGSYVHDGYTLEGSLKDGHKLAVLAIEVKETEDGSYLAIPSAAVIKDSDDKDVTDQYEISYVQSAAVKPAAPEKVKLTITAKPPVTNDGGKTYVHDGYDLSSGALRDGDKITSLTLEVKEGEDGKLQVVPSAAVIMSGETNNTALYEINYVPSLSVEPTVEKIAVTIRAKDRTAEYDGTLITADSYEITKGALEEGDTLEVNYEGGSVDATESAESKIASAVIKDSEGKDVTESKYALTIDNDNPGKVTVTKRALTVTAITGTVETDGTKTINASDCKTANGSFSGGYKAEGLLPGHELRGSFVKGSGKESFTTSIDKSALKIVDTKNGDADVTGNYEIKTVDGKITIKVTVKTDVPVVVAAKDQVWTYDGTAHRPDQTAYVVSGLLNDDVATVTLQIKVGDQQVDEVTDAGIYTIVPVVTIKTKDGAAVDTKKYSVTASSATLTVNKYDLNLEAVSDSKTYDGKALRNDNVKASALISGHKFRDKDGVKFSVFDAKGNLVTNGVVNVGVYSKKVTEVHIIDGKGAEVTDNYNIKKVDGTLTIKQGTTSQNDSTQPKTGDDTKSPILYIALIAACVLLIGTIVAYVILQNRKKKLQAQIPQEDTYEVNEVPADLPQDPDQADPQVPQDDQTIQFPDDWKL